MTQNVVLVSTLSSLQCCISLLAQAAAPTKHQKLSFYFQIKVKGL
jgi:hypothetical protein